MISLVSCIMPTHNRRPYVEQAIWYFLRQDHSKKELIILDDGKESVADLVPEDQFIRYVRLERRHSLGSKRNIACHFSREEWIAHWDDDHWFRPQHLKVFVNRTKAANSLVCKSRQAPRYRLDHGQPGRANYPEDGPLSLVSSPLNYRRLAWEMHLFADTPNGEFLLLLRQFPARQILDMRLVALNETLARVYSRIDAGRGIWKAPAGTETSLRSANLDVKLNDLENGAINLLGINTLRTFPVSLRHSKDLF